MQEDTFYFFLTIEGTMYEEVKVKVNVVEPLRTIRELIARIVVLFRLPKMDNGGNPIIYLLVRFGDDDEPDTLEFEDADGRELSLIDNDVRPGDHLCLMTRVTAGGGGEYSWDDVLPFEGHDIVSISPLEDTYDIIIPENDGVESEYNYENDFPHSKVMPEGIDDEILVTSEQEREKAERERRERMEREREMAERERRENACEAESYPMPTKNMNKRAGRKLLERLNLIRQLVGGIKVAHI